MNIGFGLNRSLTIKTALLKFFYLCEQWRNEYKENVVDKQKNKKN